MAERFFYNNAFITFVFRAGFIEIDTLQEQRNCFVQNGRGRQVIQIITRISDKLIQLGKALLQERIMVGNRGIHCLVKDSIQKTVDTGGIKLLGFNILFQIFFNMFPVTFVCIFCSGHSQNGKIRGHLFSGEQQIEGRH